MARKWWIPAALLLIGAVALLWSRRAPTPRPAPAPVAAAPTEATLTGPVTPRNIVGVAPATSGILDAWFVEPGQTVIKDQLLARVREPQLEDAAQKSAAELEQLQSRADSLEQAQLASKLEISRAEAEQARATADADRLQKIYERYKNLWDLGAIARLQFEAAEKSYNDAKVAVDKAGKAVKAAHDRADALATEADSVKQQIAQHSQAADQAKSQVSSGDIHSPADGLVISRQGDAGQPIDPSMQNLLRIATDLTQLEITLTPDPRDLARMRPGETVDVQFDGAATQGTIREIHDAQVIVDFTAAQPLAKLGETAQVKIKF